MAEYLKLYKTETDYNRESEKPSIAHIVENVEIRYKSQIKTNVIIYKAASKLPETTSGKNTGLHTNAFSGTSGQLTVTSHTFENGVGTIEFNSDVVSIGQYAFCNCNITDIILPDTVTHISKNSTGGTDGSFYKCDKLRNASMPGVVYIGKYAFNYCNSLTSIVIGNNLTNIDNYAFNNCSGLTSISLPDTVTNIGSAAFQYCYSLTDVTIPSGITKINSSTFRGCRALTNIEIPNSVTTIDGYAFSYCESLKNINIPSSVTNIAVYGFRGCSYLTGITVDANNTVYDSRNDCNAIIETNSNKLIRGCVNTIIPNNVKEIGVFAFDNIEDLTTIAIPNSVTRISSNAFEYCINLTNCNIGSGVTYIGDYVFDTCSGLTSITIPSNVTHIGSRAFYYCKKLTSINIPSGLTELHPGLFMGCNNLSRIISSATTAPRITQSDVFKDVKNNGTLYVPQGSSGYDAWMATTTYYLGYYNWTKVEQ